MSIDALSGLVHAHDVDVQDLPTALALDHFRDLGKTGNIFPYLKVVFTNFLIFGDLNLGMAANLLNRIFVDSFKVAAIAGHAFEGDGQFHLTKSII